MGAAMAHRGPDIRSHGLEPGLALLERGLRAERDASSGLPACNEDGSILAISHGSFFDHARARAVLEGRGHCFRTASPGEILVHLYEVRGEGFLEHLHGQFALAIWDRKRRRLLLARDRFGTAPLHWAQRGSRILFASEIKGILAAGQVPVELDPRGLDHLFTFFGQPGRRTCFRGVQSLLPGTCLRIEAGDPGGPEIRERRYWDFSFPARGDERDPPEDEVLGQFGAIFEEAVRMRMGGDVRLASYLSGGLDSTAVYTAACRLQGEPLPAFSIRIPSAELDETGDIGQVAGMVGAEPVTIECGGEVIGQSYPTLVEAAEAPVVVSSCGALLNLADAVRAHGCGAALTGEGADEILAGYPWLKLGRVLGLCDRGRFRPSNLLRFGVMKWVNPACSWRKANRYQRLIGGPQGVSDYYQMYGAGRQKYFSSQMWEDLGERIAYEDLDLDLESMRRWHPLNQALYFGCKTMLPGLLLNQKGDRAAMRHGVQPRYPFLDERLVDFCAGLHPRWKLQGFRRDKHLLRLHARGRLPASITERTKRLFQAPFAASFFADPPPFATQLLSEESLRRTGLFAPGAVRAMRERYVSGQIRGPRKPFVEMHLTAVMATQLWHHLYLDSGLCELPPWRAPGEVGPRRSRSGWNAATITAMTEPGRS